MSRNPGAIRLLEQNIEEIHWGLLSANPNAIHLLEQNPDEIDWRHLCTNPNAIHLFCHLDYKKTQEANEEFRLELAERIFDPDRIMRQSKRMNLSFQEYLEIYR